MMYFLCSKICVKYYFHFVLIIISFLELLAIREGNSYRYAIRVVYYCDRKHISEKGETELLDKYVLSRPIWAVFSLHVYGTFT
jgi:hypothetical protein